MGPGTDEVQSTDASVSIVHPEIGTLGQDRLEGKGRAVVSVEDVAEILRREDTDSLQIIGQSGDVALLQVSQDSIRVSRTLRDTNGAHSSMNSK